jgi:hypothetical protein
VESIWLVVKRSLANLVKHNVSELTALAKTRLRRMQYRPGLLEGFLAGTRLDLTPFCNLRIEIVSRLSWQDRRAAELAGRVTR